MASDWIVLEARVVGCSAELYVNDIPVAQIGVGQAKSVSLPVNHYLATGANTLGLLVNPGPTPAVAGAPQPEPRRAGGATALATLARYRHRAVSGDGSGEVVLLGSWAGRADGEPEAFPQRVAISGNLPVELGPWAWQNAEILTLEEESTGQVASLIELIRAGLEHGDPQPFFDLGARSLQEIAKAYDDSPDEGVKTLRAVVSHSRDATHWKFPPLPRDAWDLRLVAGGRMIECIAKDWEPIVRSVTDAQANSFLLPMLVGRVAGRWAILR